MNPFVKTYREFLHFLHFLQWFLIVQKVCLSAKTLFVKVLRLVRVFIDYSTFVLFWEGSGERGLAMTSYLLIASSFAGEGGIGGAESISNQNFAIVPGRWHKRGADRKTCRHCEPPLLKWQRLLNYDKGAWQPAFNPLSMPINCGLPRRFADRKLLSTIMA
jgi:hypothetical protein